MQVIRLLAIQDRLKTTRELHVGEKQMRMGRLERNQCTSRNHRSRIAP